MIEQNKKQLPRLQLPGSKNREGEPMIRLLIIADDFTGALDTGVQFAAHGKASLSGWTQPPIPMRAA